MSSVTMYVAPLPETNVVQRQDVWMIERGDDAGLPLDLVAGAAVTRMARREKFEGHLAAKPRVARTVYLAHRAGPKRADDFVVIDSSAGHDRTGRTAGIGGHR